MNIPVDAGIDRPLAGCAVVVTREHRGELGRLLEVAGADVVHVPLIEIADVEADRRRRLDRALDSSPDWVIVTSAAGAERVGRAAFDSNIRLGAVGTVTAERLAEVVGRPVDLIPERQLAASLVESFARQVTVPQRVVVAQADRAGGDLVEGLVAAGHTIDVHTAYRTMVRLPTGRERHALSAADAVVFASGSAAAAWHEALGSSAHDSLPGIVVAIGPTTASAAAEFSLKVSHVAAEHSLAGIIDELTNAWRDRGVA